MNFHVMTLFPEMVMNGLNTSILGRAAASGLLSFEAINIRDYTLERHGKVDDYPYGGGAGMVMQAEPIYRAYTALCDRIGHKPRVVYMRSWQRKRSLFFSAAITRAWTSGSWR